MTWKTWKQGRSIEGRCTLWIAYADLGKVLENENFDFLPEKALKFYRQSSIFDGKSLNTRDYRTKT